MFLSNKSFISSFFLLYVQSINGLALCHFVLHTIPVLSSYHRGVVLQFPFLAYIPVPSWKYGAYSLLFSSFHSKFHVIQRKAFTNCQPSFHLIASLTCFFASLSNITRLLFQALSSVARTGAAHTFFITCSSHSVTTWIWLLIERFFN